MKKKNNVLKYILNFVILILVIGLVIYFSLKDNFHEIMENIRHFSIFYFILVIVIACLYRIFIAISLYYVTKANNQNYSLKKAIPLSFITQFFNGITPFASGGQPSQVYYLHKENISYPVATNIVLQNFILYQTALILFGFFAILTNRIFGLFPQNNLIGRLVFLGFLVNFIVWIGSFVISFGKKISNFILNRLIGFASKIKLVKEEAATKEKFQNYISHFYENAMTLKNHKKEVVLGILSNVVALGFYYVIPFVIIKGMGIETNLTILTTLVASSYVLIIGSFVPIPGGTGGLEYGYVYFFGYFIQGSSLTASMLLWRTITYYLGMVVGGIMMLFYRKGDQK